jgi:multidrug efflux pump subunit AcrA (membrane-fusion protein)
LQAERYQRLFQSQSVAKSEVEKYQLAAENSLTNLNALKKNYAQLQQQAKQSYITTKGQLKSNEVAQKYNNIVVPQNGTIIEKFKTNGDYVKKGDVIATIADAKEIKAVLNIDETSIGKIKIGQQVFVKLNTNNTKVYDAKITEILSAFDEQSQSFICKAVFEEPLDIAFYGTQLEANIFTSEKKDALLIPRNLMDFGNRVNVKGKDQYVIIKTGIVSSDYVEVLEGLTKDDVLLPLKN